MSSCLCTSGQSHVSGKQSDALRRDAHASTSVPYWSLMITSRYLPAGPKRLRMMSFTSSTSEFFRLLYDGGTGVVVAQMMVALGGIELRSFQ